MKSHSLLLFSFLNLCCFAQQTKDIELSIEKANNQRIYINERTEFKSFLVNNSSGNYFVPARNLIEYPSSFVDEDYDLFGPDGKEIVVKSGPHGNGNFTSHPAAIITANGGKKQTLSYFGEFKVPGQYKLIYKFSLNANNKPSNSTTEYRSFSETAELVFEVFDRGPIPLQLMNIDYEQYKKEQEITDISKANDSTNVFKLALNSINEQDLENIAKFKNLKGLKINYANLSKIPDALFELDLYELTINLSPSNLESPFDLRQISRFKNLRILSILIPNDVIMIEDFSGFNHLQMLYLTGFKNPVFIKNLPKSELSTLSFASLEGLNGIDGDFSDYKNLEKLQLSAVKDWEMPDKFIGSFSFLELNAGPFDEFPDLSNLRLSNLKFNTFTGELLPENIESSLKNSAIVSFPKEMYNSKDYKKLKKLGFRVFPKSD